MKKPALYLFLLINVCLQPVLAEATSLQDQIDEIKIMIEREQLTNIELKAELASRESEVSELKLKLKEIEDKIETLKKEHNLT